MKKKERNIKKLLLVVFCISMIQGFYIVSTAQYIPENKRETYNFNTDWLFFKGDDNQASLNNFTDSKWINVNLPHTPMLEPFVSHCSFLGICWYRKHFYIDNKYKDKKIYIEFEAGMHKADVYINGVWKMTHKGGYLPFTVDITNEALFDGGQNIIAVKLNNADSVLGNRLPPGGSNAQKDFCFFGGLYRNSKIYFTDKLHVTDPILEAKVDSGGIFVTYSNVSAGSATINIKTHVRNEGLTAQNCTVVTTLVDSGNNIVTSATSGIQSIAAGGNYQFSQSLGVSNPRLWDVDDPYLYTVYTSIKADSVYVDDTKTRIGIRNINFTKTGGFELNGKKIKFMGADRHQDYPYIGNAGTNSLEYRDALKMKEPGIQFVRTSHYPQSPAFLDACDELGILVMSSLSGWQWWADNDEFKNNAYQIMKDMIRRDRNRPSIITWELSLNETNQSAAFSTKATSILREEYPGDQAYSCGWDNWSSYDIAIESSQGGARSYTGTNPFIMCEYGDWDFGGNSSTSRCSRATEAPQLQQVANHQQSLNLNRALSFLSGDALWVFEDYNRGYASDICQAGILDLMRLPKYSYYFYQSQRDPNHIIGNVNSGPMVFIADTWQSGSSSVKVFSNCDSVELYINDNFIKKQAHDVGANTANLLHPPFTFTGLTWEAGKIEAKAKIGGIVVATNVVYTPVTPDHISVVIDSIHRNLIADGSDLVTAYAYVKSANDAVVNNATNLISFTISGPGKLIGVKKINALAGIVGIFIQSEKTPGIITISASSSGLTAGSAQITSVPMTDEYIGVIPDLGTDIDSAWTKVDDNVTASINYSTQWIINSIDTGYLGTNHFSNIQGQVAKFTFSGTRVRYDGFKRNDLGKAEISIDDTIVDTIDCYNASAEYDKILFESATLPEGVHSIEVKVTGLQNSSSSGTGIVCDAFEYIPLEINQTPALPKDTLKREILADYYTGIPGIDVQSLTGSSIYPDSPTNRIKLDSLQLPDNAFDSYGVRIRGYLRPEVNKNYKLMIAAADAAELWLSIDDNPSNKELIASVPAKTNKYQWDKYPQQTSAPITLSIGNKYYFEVLFKAGIGDDHMAVAWENAGLIVQPIPAKFLSPYGDTAIFNNFTKINQPEIINKEAISVFPNPVNNVINITVTDKNLLGKLATISIITSQGLIVFEQKQKLNNQITIDSKKILNGFYFVKIESDSYTISKKVIISKE
jgi:Glycosyl hydrolases family 2, TIM barrel domain/Glycosyl hydrolases family 2/Glycosyl hydrolases family 2, sugar binding domain/Glycoside hydrolase family 2 C-terminal domain 5/Secretion system C-terminal sorting domain/Domain of unknown function (DUF4982)/PA14 domain